MQDASASEKVFSVRASAHVQSASLQRKLEIKSGGAISADAFYRPPKNTHHIYRGNVAISEFFEKNYRKDVEDTKEGHEKSSANYKFYFVSKMDSNYLSAFDSFIENNRTCNNVADFIKSDK